MSALSTLEANSLKGALEALLLVSSDPVSAPALAGALGAPCGMVLIAGTGSICFGRDAAGKTARSGGGLRTPPTTT